ncbi:unnamed protein product [Arctia plantaginis]|uniref:Uncharacterized protein n=1 Tax=Arctia plantaginis TaxID=874455 RepID=A0A8S0YN08_ARCPL|nr:unnamed protein product [Arctia plantaginis]
MSRSVTKCHVIKRNSCSAGAWAGGDDSLRPIDSAALARALTHLKVTADDDHHPIIRPSPTRKRPPLHFNYLL